MKSCNNVRISRSDLSSYGCTHFLHCKKHMFTARNNLNGCAKHQIISIVEKKEDKAYKLVALELSTNYNAARAFL